ncbi:MAG: hypothetical protein ACJAZ1_003248 [Yoonia sp.]|jgi:hypothetical protein
MAAAAMISFMIRAIRIGIFSTAEKVNLADVAFVAA